MKLSSILKPEAVKVLSTASSKKRLLNELGEIAQAVYGLNATVAVDALIERENLGPTGVGRGVALPHARVAEIDRVIGAFVMLEKPIEFESVDRQPVDLVFALFAPEEDGVEHLKALARVSRMLRNEEVCQMLRANGDSGTLYTILTDENSVQPA